jgi:hypothetical protein
MLGATPTPPIDSCYEIRSPDRGPPPEMTDSDGRKLQVMFGLRRTDAAEYGRGSNHLRKTAG